MAIGDSSERPKKEVPALVPGEIMTEANEKQPAVDETARKLYQDVQPATVQVYSRSGYLVEAGSGFFEKSTHDAITNSHVVIGQEEFFVRTPDGKKHQAKVVDIDDIKDLARLEVPDFEGKNQPSLSVSDHAPKPGDKVFAFGHPLGSTDLYVSPGSVFGRESQANLMQDVSKQNGHPFTHQQILDLSSAGFSGAASADIVARLEKPIDFTDVHLEHGNSGGPVVGTHKDIVGVATMNFGNISGMVTGDDLRSFVRPHEPKFKFDYENQSSAHVWMRHWDTDPWQNIKAGYADAILGGVGLRTMSSGKSVTPFLSFGLVAANDLVGNYYRFTNSASTMGKVEAGIGMVGDSVALAGSAALMLPKMRQYSQFALKTGAAIWAASKLVPSHLILTKTTRVEGPDRPPTPFEN